MCVGIPAGIGRTLEKLHYSMHPRMSGDSQKWTPGVLCTTHRELHWLNSPLSPCKSLYTLGEEPMSPLSFMTCCPSSQKERFSWQHTAIESAHTTTLQTRSLLWACRMTTTLSCLYGGKPRPGFYCPSPVTGWHVKWQLFPRVLGRSFQTFPAYHVPSTTTYLNSLNSDDKPEPDLSLRPEPGEAGGMSQLKVQNMQWPLTMHKVTSTLWWPYCFYLEPSDM